MIHIQNNHIERLEKYIQALSCILQYFQRPATLELDITLKMYYNTIQNETPR